MRGEEPVQPVRGEEPVQSLRGQESMQPVQSVQSLRCEEKVLLETAILMFRRAGFDRPVFLYGLLISLTKAAAWAWLDHDLGKTLGTGSCLISRS